MISLFNHIKVSELEEEIKSLELMAVNDLGSKLTVFSDRLEIKFVDESKPRLFPLDVKELYEKIECKCKASCFDHSEPRKRKLVFDLERLETGKYHTIRISILNSKTDNFRVEVLRSELLTALAFFFK